MEMLSTSVIAELCIYILTWNVGTHYPDNISLIDVLSLNGTTSCPNNNLPDMYVIALQEVNTKPKNQILRTFQDDPWVFRVRDHLNEHSYIKMATEQLQGILIMLFALPQHADHIQNLESQDTATGFGGLWGNKGAVSIRMSLYGTGVSFVGAHLAAHDGQLKERITDYNQIVDNHHYKTNKYHKIFDHDVVFWFGDLNFRLTGDDTAFEVRNLVEQNKIEELIRRDQLLLVRQTGNAFSLLEEELPTFPPTFKFVENSQEYDLKRRPAWCDRILHRVQIEKYPSIELSVKRLSYKSHPEYMLSDHRPVSAEFIYKIAAQAADDSELHELTHGAAEERTPLASVIIIFCTVISTIF